MPTFQEMRQYVAKRLLDASNTAVTDSDVGIAINDAIDYWSRREFWFNTQSGTVGFTANSPVMSLPDDFLVELSDDGFVLEYSSMRYPLSKVNNNSYDMSYTSGAGMPRVYTMKAGTYYAYPTPQQNYTLLVYYLKKYDMLEANEDTNDFTDNAHRLIQLWALANLMGEMRQDSNMESYYRNAAQDEKISLDSFLTRKTSTGFITNHSIL